MKIRTIGFGYTKNLGNYENCKLYLEADLEEWEDPSESLNLLRSKVAFELDLPDQWHDLKGKFARQHAALEAFNSKIETKKTELVRAEEAWDNFAEFLTAHGIDPATLTVENFTRLREEHSFIPVTVDEDDDFDPGEYYPVDRTDEDEDEYERMPEF